MRVDGTTLQLYAECLDFLSGLQAQEVITEQAQVPIDHLETCTSLEGTLHPSVFTLAMDVLLRGPSATGPAPTEYGHHTCLVASLQITNEIYQVQVEGDLLAPVGRPCWFEVRFSATSERERKRGLTGSVARHLQPRRSHRSDHALLHQAPPDRFDLGGEVGRRVQTAFALACRRVGHAVQRDLYLVTFLLRRRLDGHLRPRYQDASI